MLLILLLLVSVGSAAEERGRAASGGPGGSRVWIGRPARPDGTLPAQPAPPADPARPVVAVVLAGGGAWGFAHVGVLELIEELGIPVDIVVGTSIGSIVGAFYAAGYTAEQLAIIAETTDWNTVLFDAEDRLQLGYEDRRRRRAFRATLGFREGQLLLPAGASSAQRVVEYLDDLLRVHALTDSFLDMPRSLAIVAADLITGEEVVYVGGDLKTAIRASMSVPGAFTPVYYRERYLIDGGWVNNIPVDVARELGAEVVIAVNLNVMDRTAEDLQSIGPILDQSARIVRQQSIVQNLAQADLVITPDLRGLLPTDFQRAVELVGRGREAAAAGREELEALAERITATGMEPAVPVRKRERPEADRNVIIHDARYIIPPVAAKTAEEYNPRAIELLEAAVEELRGQSTTITGVQRIVYGLYDTGLFEYISYDIVDQTDVVLYATPRELPRSSLSLGFGVRAQLLENSLALGIAHARYTHDPGAGAARWVVDGWFSRTAGARIALEVPLAPRLYLVPATYAISENMPFYDERAVESFYVRRRFGGETGVTAYLGRSWDITLAGFGEWLALQRLSGARAFEIDGTARYGGRLEIWRDTLDRDLFPRGGSETRLSYRVHWDTEQEHWAHLVSGATRRYWSPLRRVTLRTLARGGSDLISGVALYERFFLGGTENWYGYYYQELQGRHYAVAGLDARVTVGKLPLGLGNEVFITAGAQAGGVYSGSLEQSPENMDRRAGIRGGLAFDTVLGALHLGVAVNSEGRVLSFLELGPVYTPGGTGYDW